MVGSVAKKRRIVGSCIDLPPDIIYDVLLRLRVKTLCRFRCVSKSWQALVSDPGFVEDHHRRSQQNPLLLVATFHCDTPKCRKLHISSLNTESKTQIREFAVRLNARRPKKVWTAFTRLDLVCMHDCHSVYICNPATEELFALPRKCSRNHCNYFQRKVGFGYLPSTKEYKVLRGIIPSGAGEYECYELLTLGKGNSWKAVGNPPFLEFLGAPVFASGAFYILSEYEFSIARFDLEREEWSVLQLPNEIYEEYSADTTRSLRQVNGLLCVADHGPYCQHHINLWFLKDYNKGIWAKEYRIYLPTRISCFVPLSVEPDGRILMVETYIV